MPTPRCRVCPTGPTGPTGSGGPTGPTGPAAIPTTMLKFSGGVSGAFSYLTDQGSATPLQTFEPIYLIPRPVSFTAFTVHIASDLGQGQQLVFRLLKNGLSVGTNITITGPTTLHDYIVNFPAVAFAPLDQIDVQVLQATDFATLFATAMVG